MLKNCVISNSNNIRKCIFNKKFSKKCDLKIIRCFSQDLKKPDLRIDTTPDITDEKNELFQRQNFGGISVKTWNEKFAVKKAIKLRKGPYLPNHAVSMTQFFQSFNSFPITFSDWVHFFKNKTYNKRLQEQIFLPSRVQVLKRDLAAAHFIISRGGSIKFVGKPEWVGQKENFDLLPKVYIPGLYVESINAEHTNILYEGLPNIAQLKYLTHLSLKNLNTIDDWCLDWVACEYFLTLKHLDISGCKNVTHRGLSCFYRFQCLETFNVEGVSETPEFKLACIMLLDIMPNLEIKGIDFTVPEEIYALEEEKIPKISKS